jgi:hypothetical protein
MKHIVILRRDQESLSRLNVNVEKVYYIQSRETPGRSKSPMKRGEVMPNGEMYECKHKKPFVIIGNPEKE